ncbi:MAG TPA: 2-dehydropantoate 2-reductase [Actinoplanes sp.]
MHWAAQTPGATGVVRIGEQNTPDTTPVVRIGEQSKHAREVAVVRIGEQSKVVLEEGQVTRVAVIGCGAIGSLYAAHLSRAAGVEVWAVDPWREHVEAIQAGGLRVTGRSDFVAPVRAVTDAAELPPCRLAVVATKAVHTRAAVRAAKGALADASVVSVQNGVGNEEQIAELVPRVIRGTIVTAGAVTAPGVVRYDAQGDTYLGPFEPSPAPAAEIARLARLLNEGGLVTHDVPDARGPQWTKVVFNAATSALAALTGLTVGQVCTDPGLRTQVDRLIDEALAVCTAAGIELTRDPRDSVEEAIQTAYAHKPSMLQDVLAHRGTEIDVLNGGIAAEGRRVGVLTPGHDALVALVRGLEKSWSGG